MIVWLNRLKFLIVSHHLAKFCGHRACGSSDTTNEDIIVLVCHVISQDHVIKGWFDFISRSPSRKVTILPSLVAISNVVMEMILVCHVISGRPRDRRVMWLNRQKRIMVNYYPAKFGENRQCGSADMILVCRVIKWWCDFIGRSLSRQVTIPTSFIAIGILWLWRYSGFILSRGLARPRDQRVMWISGRSHQGKLSSC